ncbi:photosystem II 5 kDa protein, chloroplastic-like [Rhododendron vialii]|uniref:photosystem II 5 kDa protein, chloroplastic-like n=1 Tax=Rhododendron vialii TaxID=182163 RepID=UPI00265E3A3B|nr:photosystem II 5 kDa protein, chloroplastic-like [Rhododendron vialii]
MASVSVTASFLGGATRPGGSPATTATATHRRSLVIIRSCMPKSVGGEGKISQEISKNDQSSSSGRRDLVFAAAAAAVCSGAGFAAAEEPKRGTPVARKIYAPVCVTMPTARICHK